jgi:hypothetical protein
MSVDSTRALHVVELIVSTGVVVATLEMIAVREAFRDEGLLSWRLQRLTHRVLWFASERLGIDALLGYPAVLGVLGLRLCAGLAVMGSIAVGASPAAALFLLASSTALVTLRSPQGNDGSDQMAAIVIVAATLSEIVATGIGRAAGLAFIAAEASLAYGISGVLKVGERGWRDGSFVAGILSTSTFGNRRILAIVKAHSTGARALGLCVAFGDCLLAIAPLLPTRACGFLLGYGVLMHLGIAAILGLNGFLWSFAASFPAMLWVSNRIHA